MAEHVNNKTNKTLQDILASSAYDLYDWFFENFRITVPSSEEIDFSTVGDLLSKSANYYTYFSSMHSMLESMVKEAKLNKEDADKSKEIMIKRDIIGNFEEQMKFTYNAISRICTMKVEGNKEMQMLGIQC